MLHIRLGRPKAILKRPAEMFMRQTMILIVILFIGLAGLSSRSVSARALFDVNDTLSHPFFKPGGTPNQQFDAHDIGKMALAVTNFGILGTGFVPSATEGDDQILSCEYPINSNLEYLYNGLLWIGAVVGRDTLVSVAADGWYGTREMYPDEGPAGAIIRRSNLRTRPEFSELAVSEQDFICLYTDTVTSQPDTDPNDNREHIPLGVAIRQASYAWSYEYAEDFVLLDFKITNIGRFPIRQMYVGYFIDADVSHTSTRGSIGFQDDISGFRRTVAAPPDYCFPEDTVNIAYIADNDGDPADLNSWTYFSVVAVTGTRVLRTPNPELSYSFNWWVSNSDASLDWGPRLAGTLADPYRALGAHRGTPTGDRNKYYLLSHPEFDYDQIFMSISHEREGFEPPPTPDLAIPIADGFDARYLLSFGPFDLNLGDTLPLTLAYIAGDKLHTYPADFENFYEPQNPARFYDKLNFEDLGKNARWADWIFDNPGIDTNEDGDSGLYCWKYDTTVISGGETEIDSTKFYYRGDGVPDFLGASPPPAPTVRVYPSFGKVIIRWNGQMSQNAVDVFAGVKDFEGFRVYYGEGNQAKDFVRLVSFDVDDYRVYEFDAILGLWQQRSAPVYRDTLLTQYGSSFDPDLYDSEQHFFVDPNSGAYLYFLPQDWNYSDLTNPNGIHRVYPDAREDDPADTTDEGWLRYYEYEYVITNIEPSRPYYFSVTAYDYGSLKADLASLESSPLVNAVRDYPLPTSDAVEEQGLGVMVYPNPYRIDGGYARVGYENRERAKSAERSRTINFANLPRVCTIRIYSVDGDLIQEIEHNHPEGGPGSQVETWNVISRNTQAVVTGVYLWHVESEMGDQVGKLVIIK